MGAAIGRNSNRIKSCKFEISNKTYSLADNDMGNNLHGGLIGFDKKVWDVIVEDEDEPSIVLTLTSPDGDEGFPGNLDVTMTYTLTKENALEIHYIAKSDADTVVNMTNHSYFNLGGNGSGTIYEHMLQMDADFYTPNDTGCVPTGEVLSVKGTPFDFTEEALLGPALNSTHEQIALFGGIDHNFAIKGTGLRHFSTLKCEKTGICMETICDLPGIMQIYSGNVMVKDQGKDGVMYDTHHAICLETQYFPNSLEMSHFPSPILKKGCEYNTRTIYKFTTK